MSIGRWLDRVHLGDASRHARRQARLLLRRLRGVDRRLLEAYLASHPVRKLQVGSGTHTLDGWLDSDIDPRAKDKLYLDATRPFASLPDDTFDYVFSEHVIEHVSYRQSLAMLAECRRVLKPGGMIRIATPDLPFLLELYRQPEAHDGYLRYVAEYIERRDGFPVPDSPRQRAIFVINNFVRDWGHEFIHDEHTLRQAFDDTGFTEIRKRELNDSDDPELRELENEQRMPPGMVALETVVLEGRKPEAGGPFEREGRTRA